MSPPGPFRYIVLALAATLVLAPLSLAFTEEDDADDHEHEPSPECWPSDRPGVWTCRPPSWCEGHMYEKPECTPPPECSDNGDGTFDCQEPKDAHDPEPHEHQDPYDEPEPYTHEDPYDEPDCRPDPETAGAWTCHPPASCRDKLYETPECTPPPECSDNGDGTFTCTKPAEEHDRYDDRREFDEPPECRPTDDPYTVTCKPPTFCEGKLYQKPECTLPPECSDNGDGTFTCHFNDGARPSAQGPDARPTSAEPYDSPSPTPVDRQDLRRALRAVVADAMDGFRAHIGELRAQYDEAREDLRAAYATGNGDLRLIFDACLADAQDYDDPRDRHDHRRLCVGDARDDLRALRADLLAERDDMRTSLLEDAEAFKRATCESLGLEVRGVLLGAGLGDVAVRDVAAPGDLRFCAGLALTGPAPHASGGEREPAEGPGPGTDDDADARHGGGPDASGGTATATQDAQEGSPS